MASSFRTLSIKRLLSCAIFVFLVRTGSASVPMNIAGSGPCREAGWWGRNFLSRIDPANIVGFAARGGYVLYNSPDGKGRARGIVALINKDVIEAKLGSSAKTSICPPGWHDKKLVDANINRCHLLGKQLGGSGSDERNLVTCLRKANSPIMSFYEDRIANYIHNFPDQGPFRRNKAVRYTVLPHYEDDDYPSRLEILAELVMCRRPSKVLHHLTITNTKNATVEFQCTGELPQDGPPSLTSTNLLRSDDPC